MKDPQRAPRWVLAILSSTVLRLSIAGFMLVMTNTSFAETIHEVQGNALKVFKETKDANKALQILERADVRSLVRNRPPGMKIEVYASILNDYGFYLSETQDRWSQAIPILKNVITVQPNRSVAHLNLADTYRKALNGTGNQAEQRRLRGLMLSEYIQYAKLFRKTQPSWALPLHVVAILEDEYESQYDELTGRINIAKGSYSTRIRSANLSDRSILVAWDTMEPLSVYFRVQARIYSSQGEVLKGSVTICENCVLENLIALPSDEVWTITRDAYQSKGTDRSARKYTRELQLLRVINLGSDVTAFAFPGYSFGALRGNAVQSISVPSGEEDDSVARLELYPLGDDGAVLTKVFRHDPEISKMSHPVPMKDGKLLLAWVKHQDRESRIYGACFDPDKGAITEEFEVGGIGNRETDPMISTVADGYLVTWLNPDFKYEVSPIYARVYDAHCSPFGPPTQLVATATDRYQVIPLASGRYLIVYQETDGQNWDVKAAVFKGQELHSEYHVAGGKNHQEMPSAALLPNGRFITFWLDGTGELGGNSERVYARIVRQQISQ